MGYIVDQSKSENVKQAFMKLKDKLQRNRDAVPSGRNNCPGAFSGHNSNAGIIRVPDNIRRMLNETFENLGLSDAEYFLQALGRLY